MFLFFGISPKIRRYGSVLLECQVHGGRAMHELASYRSWFKLFFFLPLFPVGRERHLLTCSQCGAAQEISANEAQQLSAGADQGFQQPMQEPFQEAFREPFREPFQEPAPLAQEPPRRVASRRLDRDS